MSADLDVIRSVMPKSPDTRIHSLERDLAALVAERQTMRASGAEPFELERNRREIVARQQELSEALISIYAPRPTLAAA
jgi:translation elongation factor EF-1beta